METAAELRVKLEREAVELRAKLEEGAAELRAKLVEIETNDLHAEAVELRAKLVEMEAAQVRMTRNWAGNCDEELRDEKERVAARERRVEAREERVAARERRVEAREERVAARERRVEAREERVAARERRVEGLPRNGAVSDIGLLVLAAGRAAAAEEEEKLPAGRAAATATAAAEEEGGRLPAARRATRRPREENEDDAEYLPPPQPKRKRRSRGTLLGEIDTEFGWTIRRFESRGNISFVVRPTLFSFSVERKFDTESAARAFLTVLGRYRRRDEMPAAVFNSHNHSQPPVNPEERATRDAHLWASQSHFFGSGR